MVVCKLKKKYTWLSNLKKFEKNPSKKIHQEASYLSSVYVSPIRQVAEQDELVGLAFS